MTDLNDEHREGRPLRSSDAVVLDLEKARSERRRRDEDEPPMPPPDDAPHPGDAEAKKARPVPQLPPALSTLCATLPGKYKRLPTYCGPLDRITGGGLQTRRLISIGGPPGSTKTGWALSLAVEMARRGVEHLLDPKPVLVAFAACDESRDGLLSRIGQMHGVQRSSLEEEDVSISGPAWGYVARELEQLPQLLLFDPRAEGECAYVDEMIELSLVASRALGARLVIVIDSIQTAPFLSDQLHEDETPRLAARVKFLADFVVRHDVCIIAISELNRAGYSQGATADLGSFKGSGAIEYQSDLALAMKRVKDGVPDDELVVEVTPLKNRLGGSLDPFRMRRTERLFFESVEPDQYEAPSEEESAEDERRIQKLEHLVERAILEAKNPIKSKNDLLGIVKGRRQDILRATSRLMHQGRIRGGYGEQFAVIPQTASEDPS